MGQLPRGKTVKRRRRSCPLLPPGLELLFPLAPLPDRFPDPCPSPAPCSAIARGSNPAAARSSTETATATKGAGGSGRGWVHPFGRERGTEEKESLANFLGLLGWGSGVQQTRA